VFFVESGEIMYRQRTRLHFPQFVAFSALVGGLSLPGQTLYADDELWKVEPLAPDKLSKGL
jgi:hypothetical protein